MRGGQRAANESAVRRRIDSISWSVSQGAKASAGVAFSQLDSTDAPRYAN